MNEAMVNVDIDTKNDSSNSGSNETTQNLLALIVFFLIFLVNEKNLQKWDIAFAMVKAWNHHCSNLVECLLRAVSSCWAVFRQDENKKKKNDSLGFLE